MRIFVPRAQPPAQATTQRLRRVRSTQFSKMHVYARVRIGEPRRVWREIWALFRHSTTSRCRGCRLLSTSQNPGVHNPGAEKIVHNRPVVYKETVVYRAWTVHLPR